MTNREVAMEFLRRFCARDIDGLAPLLAGDLQFTGPFHRFGSSEAYLESLRDDPPEQSSYRVLSVTESADSVSVCYDYEKSNATITVAQLFTFENQKISALLLVFDGWPFGQQESAIG